MDLDGAKFSKNRFYVTGGKVTKSSKNGENYSFRTGDIKTKERAQSAVERKTSIGKTYRGSLLK